MQFFLERKPQKKVYVSSIKSLQKTLLILSLFSLRRFVAFLARILATICHEKLVTISTGFSRTLTLVRSFWGGFLLFMVGI